MIRAITGLTSIDVIDNGIELSLSSTNSTKSKRYTDISKLPWIFKDAPETIRSNRDIVTIILEQDSSNYMYISDELKSNKELAMIAAKTNEQILQLVDDILKDDPDLIKKTLENHDNCRGLDYLEKPISDKSLAIELLRINPCAIQFIDDKLHADPDVIMTMLDKEYEYDIQKIKKTKRVN